MIDHLYIKTKMLNFEVRALIGLPGSLTVFASQAIRTRSSKSNIFVSITMLKLPIISNQSIVLLLVLLLVLPLKGIIQMLINGFCHKLQQPIVMYFTQLVLVSYY